MVTSGSYPVAAVRKRPWTRVVVAGGARRVRRARRGARAGRRHGGRGTTARCRGSARARRASRGAATRSRAVSSRGRPCTRACRRRRRDATRAASRTAPRRRGRARPSRAPAPRAPALVANRDRLGIGEPAVGVADVAAATRRRARRRVAEMVEQRAAAAAVRERECLDGAKRPPSALLGDAALAADAAEFELRGEADLEPSAGRRVDPQRPGALGDREPDALASSRGLSIVSVEPPSAARAAARHRRRPAPARPRGAG